MNTELLNPPLTVRLPPTHDTLTVRRTPLIDTLLRPALGFPTSFNPTVHVADEMLRHLVGINGGDRDRALAGYYHSGLQAFSMTDQLVTWRFGGFESIAMLDFASGYGRVTRHILGKIPGRQLTISDIMPEAVRFQEQTFDVRGMVSSVDPDHLKCLQRYDVVQAISLFSHLPKALFDRWLSRLWSLVKPGGMLIMSVHDASLLPASHSHQDYWFTTTSENTSLDPATYGSTWVSSDFVTSSFKSTMSDYSHIRLTRGLCGYQDVYAVVRERDVDFSDLSYCAGVESYIEDFNGDSMSRLYCSGWAASVDRETPLEGMEFLLNGELLASFDDFTSRPDVAAYFSDDRMTQSGFNFHVDLPSSISFSQDVAMLRAKVNGRSRIVAMGSLHALMADAALAKVKFLLGE